MYREELLAIPARPNPAAALVHRDDLALRAYKVGDLSFENPARCRLTDSLQFRKINTCNHQHNADLLSLRPGTFNLLHTAALFEPINEREDVRARRFSTAHVTPAPFNFNFRILKAAASSEPGHCLGS